MVGGSAVFGVGATSDNSTISSFLSENLGQLTLNFGGRAFSSNQELNLFSQVAYKYPNIKNIILFSGINDIYLTALEGHEDFFGNFFFSKKFRIAMNNQELRRLL